MSIGLCLHWSLDIDKQSVDKQPIRGKIMIYEYGINVEMIILKVTDFPKFELKVQKRKRVEVAFLAFATSGAANQ